MSDMYGIEQGVVSPLSGLRVSKGTDSQGVALGFHSVCLWHEEDPNAPQLEE